MKKLLISVFALVLLLASCGQSLIDPNPNPTTPRKDFKYVLNSDENGYSIEYLIDNPTYDHLEIPETYEGLPITEIIEISSNGIKTISIPASVTNIEKIICSGCVKIEDDKSNKYYVSSQVSSVKRGTYKIRKYKILKFISLWECFSFLFFFFKPGFANS